MEFRIAEQPILNRTRSVGVRLMPGCHEGREGFALDRERIGDGVES